MRYSIILIAALFISGCGSTKEITTKKYLKITDTKNFYNKAYDHGCSTKDGKYKKNAKRYNENETYKDGWDRGYYHCSEPVSESEFNQEGYKDGYLTAKTGILTIKNKNESYRQSFKLGYYYYHRTH